MSDLTVRAVVFSAGLYEFVAVPIDDAMQWADDNGYGWHPEKVIWADGTVSWAKGWWFPTDSGYKLARIGAGAYGYQTVISRESPDTAPVIC